MKTLIYTSLFLLISCSQGERSKKSSTTLPGLPETLKLGESSSLEVSRVLGEPENTYDMQNATIQTYKDGKAIKIDNGVATGYFREPKENEVHLQYWLQAWKDKSSKKEKIEGTKSAHGQYEYQLICEEEKTTIVFDEENGLVKRVIHYEK